MSDGAKWHRLKVNEIRRRTQAVPNEGTGRGHSTMKAIHKKLIVVGLGAVVLGILLSVIAPVIFQPVALNIGPNSNDPLITYTLGAILLFAQSFLTPFGATLTAIGVALHWMERQEATDKQSTHEAGAEPEPIRRDAVRPSDSDELQ